MEKTDQQRAQEQMVSLSKKIFNVKQELGSVKKTSNNPFFKSKYADLNSHLDLVEPVLEKHGLVLLQPTRCTSATTSMVETQIHDVETGAMVTSALPVQGDDMQKLGSAITYARRYTLGALLGLKAEDDDGNIASGLGGAKPKKAKSESKNFDF